MKHTEKDSLSFLSKQFCDFQKREKCLLNLGNKSIWTTASRTKGDLILEPWIDCVWSYTDFSPKLSLLYYLKPLCTWLCIEPLLFCTIFDISCVVGILGYTLPWNCHLWQWFSCFNYKGYCNLVWSVVTN